MKLRIVHQNQGSVKTEGVEVEPTEESPVPDFPAHDWTKENSAPLEAAPVSYFDPMPVSGKRKRKPKEMFDEMSPITVRRKTKPSASKSKDGTPNGGGIWASKGDGNCGGSSAPDQFKSPTLIRAEEVLLSLGSERPSFLKFLVRSHVGSCFWMGLPVPFCKVHLPTRDAIVFLETENGEEFPIKYIAHKTGLSAGWRRFVAGNKLLEGDVLIFQLTGPCRFKVYIIRANDLTEVDGALSLLILDSQPKHIEAEGSIDVENKKNKRLRSLPLTVVQEKQQPDSPQFGHPDEHSGNDSDEVASEVLEGTKFIGSSSQLNDVKSYEDFRIVVNGTGIDSEFPEQIRRKYYDLCCSQNAFLHDCLLPGLHSKLASGILVETINIADAIRSCTLTSPRKDFEVWDKSLRSFELLGLNVGFLRARLSLLLSLSHDSIDAVQVKRYREAQEELHKNEEEIQKVEAKLSELKELSAKYRHDMESLKGRAENYELKFREEAEAPW